MKINTSESFYNPAEIQEYLVHTGFFPSASELSSLESIKPDLPTLTKIVRKHLIAFPFENLDIHYTREGFMDVSPKGVFERMVRSKKGLGSYCFGQNTLLLGVLKGLGFRVAAGAARVNSSSDSARLVPLLHNHMVLFVQLPSPSPESPNSVPDQIYLTDVGFGGIYGMSGLVRPIPLIPSISHPGSAPPEEHRLEIGSHPDSVLDSDEYWLLQARCGRPEWKTFYLFKLQEFYLGDFQEFSLSVSRPGAGVISSLVIVVKSAVLGKPEVDNDANPLQRYMVAGDKYVKRVGDQVEVLKVFQNEEERMEAIMSEECGIVIDDKEEALKSIEGKVSMLQDAGISANNF